MITIIPDIHGRVFWKKAVDSMDFKKSNPERVVLLLGNHDWVVFHRVCPEPVPRTDIVGELLGNSFTTPILGLPRVHRQSSLRSSGNPHDG